MNLAVVPDVTKTSQLSLEEGLDFLSKYGKPKLHKTNDGWWCFIEMFITGAGVSFEVKSEYSVKTHTEAVNQCIDRMDSALKQLEKK